MSSDLRGLLLGKIITFLYGVAVIYRINTGVEHYWSALVLPSVTALALWRPRVEGWHFLRVAFFLHLLYYGFAFVRGLWWLGFNLAHPGIVLIWGGAATIFLAAAIFVENNKPLFENKHSQPSSRLKNVLAILLAAILLFLPRIEQTAWTAFDPRVFDNQEEISSLCFSPDGKKIGVISAGATINIWDVETKTVVSLHASRNASRSLAFSPDGRYVAIGFIESSFVKRQQESRETLKFTLLELASGKQIALRRAEPVPPLEDSHTQVSQVVFSPDSAFLACASGFNKVQIELWDIGAGKLAKTIDTKSSGIASAPLAYSPDGRFIATKYAYDAVAIWDIEKLALEQKLTEGYKGNIYGIAYSPDCKYLAVAFNKEWPGARSTEKGFIDIWDVATGKIYKTLQWDSDTHIMGLSYSHDGKYIASYLQLEDVVKIWDVVRGRQVETLTGPVYGQPVAGIAYSPDGRYLAVASGQYIKLYNVRKDGN